MSKKSAVAPRQARRAVVARPLVPERRLPPVPAERAVKQSMDTYFAAFAAHKSAGATEAAVESARAEMHAAIARAEAEYHDALHHAPRAAGRGVAADGSRTAAERAATEAARALEAALASYRAWDESLRSRGGGLYLRPDPIAALGEALRLVETALARR